MQRTFISTGLLREAPDRHDLHAYTPYEVRNIGALVQLGQRNRANALVDFSPKDQKPTGSRSPPSVVTRGAQAALPRRLPHTWVGTDFIRSALDMLAYDRESDSTTVLAAGVPAAWVQTAPGVRVADSMTPYGRLDYSVKAIDAGVTLRIEATSGRPPGGFVLKPPLEAGPTKALVNGRPASTHATGMWSSRRSRPRCGTLVERRVRIVGDRRTAADKPPTNEGGPSL